MRRFAGILIAAAVVSVIADFAARPAAAQRRPRASQRPNIILILTDDIGYGDLGCYGAPDIKTPNIDRLAREGVRLTDFYAAPQCTPTRASLISGRYQQRVGLERALGSVGPWLEKGLPATGRSLPQLLKNNGYATALVGKWHLGYKPEFSPNAHGFDYFFGFLSGYIDFYTHTRGGDGLADLQENGVPVREDGYMTDLITKRAVRVIEQHTVGQHTVGQHTVGQHAAEPFFLEVAYNAAHWPFQPPDRYSKSANNSAFQGPQHTPAATRKDYIAMVERTDDGVGMLMQKLDALGLTRNTLVIFTNDNGGEWLSRNAPLFHRKDTLWEGGIRVPAVFRWPGRIPAGGISRQVGITMDLTASILAAATAPVPVESEPDGMNILPILEGRRASVARTLFWRIKVEVRHQRAVRQGDWKLLIDGDDVMLYNLRTDIGERNDLAARRPDVVARLHPLIGEWEKEVDR